MRFTPMTVCRTRTWPGPGGGRSTSTYSRTSGPPVWLKRMAFMACPYFVGRLTRPMAGRGRVREYRERDLLEMRLSQTRQNQVADVMQIRRNKDAQGTKLFGRFEQVGHHHGHHAGRRRRSYAAMGILQRQAWPRLAPRPCGSL